jgi:hypothetical protein
MLKLRFIGQGMRLESGHPLHRTILTARIVNGLLLLASWPLTGIWNVAHPGDNCWENPLVTTELGVAQERRWRMRCR